MSFDREIIILVVQVIASLGVVVSVVYLGIQIHQQNVITKAQFGHSLTQRLYDRYFQTSKDNEGVLAASLQTVKKIKIVRSNNNKKKIYFFDLTESTILHSNFYYLHNKDLVYIQPLKFKGLKKSQSQLLLSSLTTFAVLFNAILNFNRD